MIQWQHGVVVDSDPAGINGSLQLTPIAGDGRQLLSEPCLYKASILSHYDQPETFSKYEVIMDGYQQRMRLNLYQWDGTPMNPMWLAYSPPSMLPTTTLSVTEKTATPESVKRAAEEFRARRVVTSTPLFKVRNKSYVTSQILLWLGLSFTAAGSVLLYWF